jgi:hypothetical protein
VVIGVHTSETLRPFAEEFFELFKTPWEFYSADQRYDAIICCGIEPTSYSTRLLLIYSGRDEPNTGGGFGTGAATFLNYQGDQIPIYANESKLERSVTVQVEKNKPGPDGRSVTVVRIDYNLFLEVAFLLSYGQPVRNAATPALELHISLLRDLLIQYTEYLIEIPSNPADYSMIACLTHDVDHPSIRNSRVWPTILGFLYRSTFGSAVEACRGRKNLGQLINNWRAAFSLPFIYAGVARDIWDSFDSYTEMEKPRPSTYFFIPIKDRAGRDTNGIEHPKRASAYAASGLSSSIASLRSNGREIGVHGIDAWRDAADGVKERQAISVLTGEPGVGVRMHWLYYDRQTPLHLERAGYDYDSTVGYNETVGYRAGTMQVFKPLGVSRLLELPLHIMDTALFYPEYLDLNSREATDVISQMVSQAQRFGGAITINWHDRSLAPERLWGEVYQDIIQQLTKSAAWFATCRDAVAWFRQRRSIVFDSINVNTADVLHVSIRSKEKRNNVPPLRLRIHPGKGARFSEQGDAPYLDFDVSEPSQDFRVAMHFSRSNEVCATS